MTKQLIVPFVLVVGLLGCKHDVATPSTGSGSPGSNGCNSSVFTYSAVVMPIIQANCNSCHSGPSASAGLDYTNFSVLKNVALNGRLLGAINHMSGYSPMPKGGAKLSSCAIEQITKWVNAGAPNN